MYSVVLMAALSGGTATPDWCLRWACHGCHSCHGCHWCGCGGCGWCGGWCGCGWGGHGYRGHFGMYAPVGGSFCDFCGCYACYGNGGFSGGFYGNGLYGNGGWCHGCWCGAFHATGCYCGHSGWGVPAGTVVPGNGVPAAPPAPANGKDKNGAKIEKQARLIVSVPAEAKVYIDGQLMKTSADRRAFATPSLRPGQTYFYDVRAEVVRDGQTVSRSQRVYLRAGDVVTASFDELNLPATTARSDE